MDIVFDILKHWHLTDTHPLTNSYTHTRTRTHAHAHAPAHAHAHAHLPSRARSRCGAWFCDWSLCLVQMEQVQEQSDAQSQSFCRWQEQETKDTFNNAETVSVIYTPRTVMHSQSQPSCCFSLEYQSIREFTLWEVCVCACVHMDDKMSRDKDIYSGPEKLNRKKRQEGLSLIAAARNWLNKPGNNSQLLILFDVWL